MRRILLPIVLFALAASAHADHNPIDVAIRVAGPAFAPIGSEVTYTLNLTAVFPGAAYAVTDLLPPNTRFVRAEGRLWNCLVSQGKVTCGNERLDSGTSSIDVTILAPETPQTMTNNVHVDSVSVFDPFLDNNTDSVTTTIYDPAICGANSIAALWPDTNATVVGPHVTLQWSPVPSASRYEVYIAENSSVLTLLGSTSDTEIAHDFTGGEVQWYVQAVLPDCPSVSTTPRSFFVAPLTEAPARHRAAQH